MNPKLEVKAYQIDVILIDKLKNYRLYLYSEECMNGIKYWELVMEFNSWSEFFSIATDPYTFLINPFITVSTLRVLAHPAFRRLQIRPFKPKKV